MRHERRPARRARGRLPPAFPIRYARPTAHGEPDRLDTFRWISTVFSMILGLGVARLLASAVAVFRARRRAILDWVPMAWALFIFLQQLAFWWSMEELATAMRTWTFPNFLLIVALVLALFLAAALVLPPAEIEEGTNLRRHFEADGRWALIPIAAFNALAILANALFWNMDVLTLAEALNFALCLLPLIAFASPRPIQIAATLLYIPLGLYAFAELLPSHY